MKVIIRNQTQLAQAKEDLELLRKSWRKILQAQSYSLGDQQINRASLKQISEQISDYETAIAAYEENGTGKRKMARFVPLD